MRLKGLLKLRCKGCYYAKIEGVPHVLCNDNPRHKQKKITQSKKWFCWKKGRDPKYHTYAPTSANNQPHMNQYMDTQFTPLFSGPHKMALENSRIEEWRQFNNFIARQFRGSSLIKPF
eukprot:TRINITY_DN11322_c0_g2_i2.p2 TRINITY_DN11322_c0_g2~~TRINITY_DN11322_c0_g2_i2.p2  ORF type:complete len:118 (-),score=7.36 TRINITY_DN11322_c0_g2_i2:1038-1391(-)